MTFVFKFFLEKVAPNKKHFLAGGYKKFRSDLSKKKTFFWFQTNFLRFFFKIPGLELLWEKTS